MRCEDCGQEKETAEDPNGFHHSCIYEQTTVQHHDSNLADTINFMVKLGLSGRRQAATILRIISELAIALLRLHDRPDTLNVTLTPGGSVNLGQQQTALVSETNSVTGTVFPVTGATGIQYSVDNTAVATVSPNPDGTATVMPVAVGTTVLTATDPNNNLSGTTLVTVTAVVDQPDTLTVTLSAPFPAGTSGNAGTVAAAVTTKSGAKPV